MGVRKLYDVVTCGSSAYVFNNDIYAVMHYNVRM